MATKVLPPALRGNFESRTLNHTRTKPRLTGLNERNSSRADSGFESSVVEDSNYPPPCLASQLNTPDSGFFGAASISPLKTPESDISSIVATPTSGGSGSCHRKRKTVTIDESQTSIVVISPDDLFNTYSKSRGSSLESRDNPFLPGGELSREAEALLSRATIIRDQFYLNDEERRALREHELQQQRASGRHVEIVDQLGDHVHTSGRPVSSTSSTAAGEDRIMPQSAVNTSAAVGICSPNGGDSRQHQPRENGKMKGATISPDSDKLTDGAATNQPGVASTPGGGAAHSSGGGATQSPAGGDLQVHDLGKKKRKSCCSIM